MFAVRIKLGDNKGKFVTKNGCGYRNKNYNRTFGDWDNDDFFTDDLNKARIFRLINHATGSDLYRSTHILFDKVFNMRRDYNFNEIFEIVEIELTVKEKPNTSCIS